MSEITGADVLQYGALGLCFTMITASVYVIRYGIKFGSGAASTLGNGLLEFATSNKLLADKLDAMSSTQRHSEDTNVANRGKLIEHDERAKSIQDAVRGIDRKVDSIDTKIERLHCVRAKIDAEVQA